VKRAVIDDTMTIAHTTPQGAQVLLPVREKIRPLVDEMFWNVEPDEAAAAGTH